MRVPVLDWFRSKLGSLDLAGSRMMYSPDKMMGSKGLHGAPITAPGCFPSGRYSPPPYRAAPDPMPPPPRRCMPNPTVSNHSPPFYRSSCLLFSPVFFRFLSSSSQGREGGREGQREGHRCPIIKDLFDESEIYGGYRCKEI